MNDYKENLESYTINFETLYNKLKEKTKYTVSKLFVFGNGPVTIINHLNLKEDFKGIYAFWENESIVYVGISRNVIRRLCQHIKGTTHHSATFPIKLLKTDNNNIYGKLPRAKFTSEIINEGQKEIKKLKVSFLPIEDDIELYLFEVYCAVMAKAKYNSFETH